MGNGFNIVTLKSQVKKRFWDNLWAESQTKTLYLILNIHLLHQMVRVKHYKFDVALTNGNYVEVFIKKFEDSKEMGKV